MKKAPWLFSVIAVLALGCINCGVQSDTRVRLETNSKTPDAPKPKEKVVRFSVPGVHAGEPGIDMAMVYLRKKELHECWRILYTGTITTTVTTPVVSQISVSCAEVGEADWTEVGQSFVSSERF
jgi:hypothetical protein